MQKRISTIPFTDTPEQHEKLLAVIESLKNEKGAVMAALHKAQDIYGYLPIEVQKEIARGLDVSLEEVYGVSTFYSQFSLTPKGKYNISICLGTACYVKGADRFSTVSLQSSASSRRNVRRMACSHSPHVAASAPAALRRSSPSTKTFTAVSFPRTWIRFLQNTQRKPCASFR